jgi:NAD-dependent SIR2 family protein deacetylase
MSVDYAAGLSEFDDLGVCGLDEIVEDLEQVKRKVETLAQWLTSADGSAVVHAGAGISTSAGIPDFRGKSGVWTKLIGSKQRADAGGVATKREEKVERDNVKQEVVDQANPEQSASMRDDNEQKVTGGAGVVTFDRAKPTTTHMVLKSLCLNNLVGHIISQNVDGLFLRCK